MYMLYFIVFIFVTATFCKDIWSFYMLLIGLLSDISYRFVTGATALPILFYKCFLGKYFFVYFQDF